MFDLPTPNSIPIRLSRPEAGVARILAELDSACAVAGWTEAAYASVVGHDLWDWRIALIGSRACGYYLSRLLPPEMELMAIGVLQADRGRGVGKALLEESIREAVRRGCDSCSLEVRVSNQGAVAFYKRNGFTPLYVRRRYYHDPTDDALVFERRLERSAG